MLVQVGKRYKAVPSKVVTANRLSQVVDNYIGDVIDRKMRI